MTFIWDKEKERINIEKHGMDFSTAALVFGDPDRIEKYDSYHSLNEDRYITIGKIRGTAAVILVVYTERRSAIRMISARIATKREEETYYHEKKH